MGLRVMIDGVPWLADVGFGGCVSSAPLRMDTSEPQKTRHVTFRLVPSDGAMRVEALIGDAWAPLYELSDSSRSMTSITCLRTGSPPRIPIRISGIR